MANNYKDDDSFLRKLVLGAAGTNATINKLQSLGFNPIELERGSTGFKIWKKIKIKRIRVPDILCLDTGVRFESRGKTKPEISMSHSLKDPKRAWDAGMRDDDFVAIVVFEQSDTSPIDTTQISPIHFILVGDMRRAFSANQISITKPKGVEEGSEIRVIWTSAYARETSIVSSLAPNKLAINSISTAHNQSINLIRAKGQIVLQPQVAIGDTVEANQIIAAVVPVKKAIACSVRVGEEYFVDRLESISLSERYAAAKALRYRGYQSANSALYSRMNDHEEDIYVQLEAAAALAAYNDAKGWDFITTKLFSPVIASPLETQLETIIVTSEIPGGRSEAILIDVLKDAKRNVELRAGAAWALGQFTSQETATALASTFNSSSSEIKEEAARSLLKFANLQVPFLLELLQRCNTDQRDGLAWVLARTGKFKPSNIITGADDNLRRWISYIIGYGLDNFVQEDIEAICNSDPDIYFAASVLWQVLSSWTNGLKEY